MRPGAALAASAALAFLPGTALALEAGDVAWGCKDAGYVQPVERDGRATAYRALMLLVHTDWGVLPATAELPEDQLYTGAAPACVDLDGDGRAEVVAAIAGPQGAWLTVYGKHTGPIASTRPAAGGVDLLGGADLDGDGTAELAWIEDPDGAGRLRVADLRDGVLAELASADGFATPPAGDDATASDEPCAGRRADLILPAADHDGLRRVRLADGRLTAERIASADPGAPPATARFACSASQNEDNK